MADTDVRIKDVAFSYEDFRYRTPIKFGGVALDKVTLLNVTMTVETVGGTVARGFGSMPLGNVWAWPSKELGYADTLAGMKQVAVACRGMYTDYRTADHPIAIGSQLEHTVAGDPDTLTRSLNLPGVIPRLAILVVTSAFDAALHDAYGKAHGVNCYHTYGPPFYTDDLSVDLGPEFKGERLEQYISKEPRASLPLYHLVGALDPLTPAEVKEPVGDGQPEHLGEWITCDGLTHLKIKLNGDDAGWDVARVVGVNRVASDTAPERAFQFSLDFNERCRNVEYLLEVLHRIREQSPAAFDRIQYVEQPTARDLKANPANRMHEAAKLKPVVIDESLLDLETLQQARDLGYTGVAFKACKGQTQSLLLAAAAQKYGLFRCVQDLTCPGASLIHSAGLAAHIPGVAAIEANSRQYCPAANAGWDERFPGVFTIRNGRMNTGLLTGPGLGAME
ncbi:MAG: mandelate racemase/muconate lactonizing enzyme family protein [Gemmataceae bacterium]